MSTSYHLSDWPTSDAISFSLSVYSISCLTPVDYPRSLPHADVLGNHYIIVVIIIITILL